MKQLKQTLEAALLVVALPLVAYAELNRGGSDKIISPMASQKTETVIQEQPAVTAKNDNDKTFSIFSFITNIDL